MLLLNIAHPHHKNGLIKCICIPEQPGIIQYSMFLSEGSGHLYKSFAADIVITCKSLLYCSSEFFSFNGLV